jgi:hypothetical protein
MIYTKNIRPFPPGISAHRRAMNGGGIYEFAHERLGPIGSERPTLRYRRNQSHGTTLSAV